MLTTLQVLFVVVLFWYYIDTGELLHLRQSEHVDKK